MKKALIVLSIIFLAVSVFVLSADMILKTAVENILENVYDLKLHIGFIRIGILKPIIHIKGLILFNPSSFTERVMLDVPEIFVHYRLRGVMKSEIRIYEMRLDLRECLVVKDSSGRLNIDAWKLWKNGPPSPAGTKPFKMHIDKLRLKIGRAVYKDYTKGPPPEIREFDINIEEDYEDIEDLYTLGRLILARSVHNTFIPNLAGFDVGALDKTLGAATFHGGRIVRETRKVAEDAFERTAKTLNNMTGGLTDVLNAPAASERDKR